LSQHFARPLAVVPHAPREIDCGHPAGAELTAYRVPVRENCRKAADACHRSGVRAKSKNATARAGAPEPDGRATSSEMQPTESGRRNRAARVIQSVAGGTSARSRER